MKQEARKVELIPQFNNQKSFYGKAHKVYKGDKVELQSYQTIVATYENEKLTVHGLHSATTLRHIKDFIFQLGLPVGKASQIEDWYMD